MSEMAEAAHLPEKPFRGMQSFRYTDGPIFFAREAESSKLVRLVTIYRGTLLYGDSGLGKSSLINARFLNDIVSEGFRPERVRLQPRPGEEFIVERISMLGETEEPFLPSQLTLPGKQHSRTIFSAAAFQEAVKAAQRDDGIGDPVLIFDQFEELVTQFEEAPTTREAVETARNVQTIIVNTILTLLRDGKLRVKLLFVFREDYLAKIHRHFVGYPDLADRYLRLAALEIDQIDRIIRGPISLFSSVQRRNFSDEFVERLVCDVRARFELGKINLTELQIICLGLWESTEPDALLTERGLDGVIQDCLVASLQNLDDHSRGLAIGIFGVLVTDSGARNIISQNDLEKRLATQENFSKHALDRVLSILVEVSRLVRREWRHKVAYYEIVSEFLIPWILQKMAERAAEDNRREREKQLHDDAVAEANRLKWRVVGTTVVCLVFGLAVLTTLLCLTLNRMQFEQAESRKAIEEKRNAEAATEGAKTQLREAQKAVQASKEKLAEVDKRLREAAAETAKAFAEREAALNLLKVMRDGLKTGLDSVPAEEKDTKKSGGTIEARRQELANALQVVSSSVSQVQKGLEPKKATDKSVRCVVLQGHSDAIWTVSVSRDGKRIATASADKTVRIWGLAGNLEAILVASATPGGATCAALSNDGRFVATGSAGQAVRVFEIATKAQMKVWASHLKTVTSISYSPKNSTIRDSRFLTSSADHYARLWSGDKTVDGEPSVDAERKILADRWLHPAAVTDASFSADGKYVVTDCEDGKIRIWDAIKPIDRPAKEVAPGSSLRGAVFSPIPGSLTIAAASGANLVLWDTSSKFPQMLKGHSKSISGLTFSPDGNWVATAGADGDAYVWRAKGDTANPVRLGETRDQALCIAWSSRNMVAVGRGDGTVELWDMSNPSMPQGPIPLDGHTGPVCTSVFTPDGAHLVTASATVSAPSFRLSDKTARVWDVPVTGR